jgi:DNA-binding GntR family transcriptional regulator
MRSNVTGTALCAMRDGVFYRGEDLAVEAGLSVTQARAVLGRLSRGGAVERWPSWGRRKAYITRQRTLKI